MNKKPKIKILTGYLLVLPLLFFSSFDRSSASYGGSSATDNPWTVGITIVTAGGYGSCSGTLVSQSVVITAGHCVIDSNGNLSQKVYVNLPKTYFDPSSITGSKIRASKVIVPNDINVNSNSDESDIAFILLSKPIYSTVYPRIATENDILGIENGTQLWAYGFGRNGDLGYRIPNFAYQYDFQWSADVFDPNYPHLNVSSNDAIGCKGDSGGPLIYTSPDGNIFIVGETHGVYNSNGDGCANVTDSGLYLQRFTTIYPFLNYVQPYLSQVPQGTIPSLPIPPSPVTPKVPNPTPSPTTPNPNIRFLPPPPPMEPALITKWALMAKDLYSKNVQIALTKLQSLIKNSSRSSLLYSQILNDVPQAPDFTNSQSDNQELYYQYRTLVNSFVREVDLALLSKAPSPKAVSGSSKPISCTKGALTQQFPSGTPCPPGFKRTG